MKITATYKTNKQVGPDDWDVYTEVVHLEEGQTLEEVREIIGKSMKPTGTIDFPINVQLHFGRWEKKVFTHPSHKA